MNEWTSDHQGLVFALAITIPPIPPNIVSGTFKYEKEPLLMVRCVTVDLLNDKYNITATPGVVCHPTTKLWLLTTATHVSDIVDPDSLRSCLQNL